MINKEFDIVVFGATSFVGKILSNYLTNEHIEPNLSWAMAARSEAKLLALKKELGERAETIPHIVADSMDEDSLRSMCDRAAVIISTVGPYALYGELLVKVCSTSGTDYCDLTGEAHWIRRMIENYQADAQASGARIVHSCGFDSLPSDLGVQFLQQHSQLNFGRHCERVKMRVKGFSGGASGGTIASALNLFKEVARDASLRAEMQDLYSICPTDHGLTAVQQEVAVGYDQDFDAWVGPFIMAAINTRIVLRSAALLGNSSNANFHYDEGTLTGAGRKGEKRAKRLALGTRMMPVALAVAPIRWLAVRFFLPKPGEGPSQEQQLNGFYDLRFFGSTGQGGEIRVKVTGDRDPGYGSTAKMLAQAGISLRRDVDKGDIGGGFWTPATVFGTSLLERLQAHAGMTFELSSVSGQTTDEQESGAAE